MVNEYRCDEAWDTLKIAYDAEFTGLTKDAELLSIGLVSDSGALFYAEVIVSDEIKEKVMSIDFMLKNVISNMYYWYVCNPYIFMHEFDIAEDKGEHGILYKRSDHPSDDESTFLDELIDGKPEKRVTDPPYKFYKHRNIYMKDTLDNIRIELMKWMENELLFTNYKKIEIISDCYAYDWVLFNDFMWGNALNIPKWISYIPVDLSTVFRCFGVDPDISRESYIGDELRNYASRLIAHDSDIDIHNPKHNSLWDAAICFLCYFKLTHRKGY